MELVDDLSVSNPVEALTPAIVKLFREMKPWSPPAEDGGSGVREPRQPDPTAGGGSAALLVEEPVVPTDHF